MYGSWTANTSPSGLSIIRSNAAGPCEKYPALTMDCEIFLRRVVKHFAAATIGGGIARRQRPIKGAITEQ
jgi:hypothetical protein